MNPYLLLLLVNLIFQLVLYNRTSLQFDELLMFNLIERFDFISLIKFLFMREVQMPLQYILVKLISYLSLESSFLRIPTLVMSLMLPIFMYRTARERFNSSTALIPTILLSLSLPVLVYSHSLRPYTLLLLTSLISLKFFREDLHTKKTSNKTIFSYIILFLSHPVGAVLALTLSLTHLFRLQKQKLITLIFLAVAFALLTSLIVARFEIPSILLSKTFDLEKSKIFLANISFIFSGAPFSLLLFILILFTAFKAKSLEDLSKSFDLFNLCWLLLPIALGVLLSPWIGDILHARYFIISTPAIFLLTTDLLSFYSSKSKTLLTILLGGALLVKAFAIDHIHNTPYEIDSQTISQHLIYESQKVIPIINCGNCLSYYIKGKNLRCLGEKYDYHKLTDITSKLLYVEFDFVKETCGIQHIDRRVKILEKWNFPGGNVYLMDRSPLQYTQHPD